VLGLSLVYAVKVKRWCRADVDLGCTSFRFILCIQFCPALVPSVLGVVGRGRTSSPGKKV